MPDTVTKTAVLPQASPAQLQRPPLLLQRYRVVEHRGSGGFATVDVCWDTRLRRRVAIKRIPLAQDDEQAPWQLVNEALSEARTSCLLAHPNIVTVFDFEYDSTYAYLVMEYVDGLTLAEMLSRVEGGRLTLDETAHVVDSLANALAFAHENGVLHLDIKPANVMIDRGGTVKLCDFGMATLASAAGFGGARGGTVGYMSPEQLTGEIVDERSDVFSLGVLVYEMLAGRNPFAAPDVNKSLKLIENGANPLADVIRDVPPEVSDALEAALSPGQVTRPQSVGDFADELMGGLGDPLSGRDSIRQLMGQVEEEDEVQGQAWARARRDAHRVNSARLVPVGVRIVSALVGGVFAWIISPPLTLVLPQAQLVAALLVALLSALLPMLGSLLAIVLLTYMAGSIGTQAQAFPLAVGFGTACGLWWLLFGRRDRLAGAALLLPSVTGVSSAGAALAGFGCSASCALFTGAAAPLLGGAVRAIVTSDFEALAAGAEMGAFFGKPSTWVVSAACAVGSWVASLLSADGHAVRSVIGQVLCAAAVNAGLCFATYLENGGTWAQPRLDGVAVAVSFSILLALASVFAEPASRGREDG